MPPSRTAELTDIVERSAWLMRVLGHAATVDAPDWWIGAGVIRDVVWDERFGSGFDPANVKDVDLVFFDARDLRPERDCQVEEALAQADPTVTWDAKNQAAVHLWFPERFGTPVDPLRSTVDGVATWPEYATCVAVRLGADHELEVAAPHGLDDLLDGRWRRNPVRVTADEYAARLRRKDPARRWPAVRVDAP